jgi:hypothetical protein
MVTHQSVYLMLENWNFVMISIGVVLWSVVSMIVIYELSHWKKR